MSSLRPYIPVFKFVATFSIIYIGLSLAYYVYLNQDYTGLNYPDPITAQVSYQTQQVLVMLGYDAQIVNTPNYPSIDMFINGSRIYYVIDGCNAVSIIILFVAFVLAFAKAWKKTALFILTGTLFIYLVNIFRLVILAIVMHSYPTYNYLSHDIIFPAIIYGSVVLLWIYWIRKPKKS